MFRIIDTKNKLTICKPFNFLACANSMKRELNREHNTKRFRVQIVPEVV